MIFRTTAFKIFVLLLLFGAVQMYYYYPKLPASVATHFNTAGEADVWMSKGKYIIFSAIIFYALAFLFFGICFIIPRIPPSLVNLPNKQYWLAEERKEETYADLSKYTLWFANATIVFLLVMHNETIAVNLRQSSRLGDSFWLFLAVYLIFTVIWCISLFTRFRKPQSIHP